MCTRVKARFFVGFQNSREFSLVVEYTAAEQQKMVVRKRVSTNSVLGICSQVFTRAFNGEEWRINMVTMSRILLPQVKSIEYKDCAASSMKITETTADWPRKNLRKARALRRNSSTREKKAPGVSILISNAIKIKVTSRTHTYQVYLYQ